MPNPYENLTEGLPEEMRPRVEEYLRTGDTTPFRADLDLTTACNYRCAHCGDAAQGLLNRGELPWDVIEQVLDDFAALGVLEVCLIGGGEPMLSPHFVAALEGLAQRNIRCGVTTNGSRITPDVAEALAKWVSWVRVSLDAATDATYRAVHRPQDGPGLEAIQRALQSLAREMPGRVGVGFLILKSNVEEMCSGAEQSKNSGLAHIRYRFANHPLTGRVLPAGDPAKVQAALEEAWTLQDEAFHVSVAESTLLALRDGEPPAQPKAYTRCHAQAFTATVTGTGDVYVCSKWRGQPWACLGNVRQNRLAEIWHSPHRRHLLDALNPHEACSAIYCHADGHNKCLHALPRRSGQAYRLRCANFLQLCRRSVR